MQILLVTNNNEQIMQAKTMYDSLDTNYIYQQLASAHQVKVVTHHQLINQIDDNTLATSLIIFTSSQIYWYKQYICEFVHTLNDEQLLIPCSQAIFAHENKIREYLWLKQIDDDSLDCFIYGDSQSFWADKHQYPFVLKTPMGSSSRGVTICHHPRHAKRFLRRNSRKQLISELSLTPLIQWPIHFLKTRNNCNFVVQQHVAGYQGDYRVQIMGDKYFVYYRKLKANKQYTSGHQSVNHYDFEVDFRMLDKARYLQAKINSPHIIFDFVIDQQNIIRTIEFSAIHPSIVALSNCQYYYVQNNHGWCKQQVAPGTRIEDYFLDAYFFAINSHQAKHL